MDTSSFAAKATILIADDDEDIRLALSLLLSAEGYQVLEAANPKEITLMVNQQNPDLVLLDMNFSRDTTSGREGLEQLAMLAEQQLPVILMTAWGSIELAVQGLQQGAADFIEKPWDKHRLLKSIKQQLQVHSLKQQNSGYKALLSGGQANWISESPAMRALDAMVDQVARTDANVLILGENGTGKSQLAKRLHQLSAREQGPFISVNMAAIPDNLFESELFGHQKGAFTDAKQNRSGRFELAHGGSLFLDEIGTLPLALQPKLLRVLETGEYEVLGSSKTQLADVRLISATNADLQQLVADKAFRQDLLFRLNTLVLTLPPLRERQADIAPLADHFLAQFSQRYQKAGLSLSVDAIAALKRHDWPGNVRELSHVIERAVLLSTGDCIDAGGLMIDGQAPAAAPAPLEVQPLEQVEQQMIQLALAQTDGQVAQAANLLGISRNALYRRLEKFGISHDT